MALTMTRTGTQTAQSKLALMVANVHGELAFLEGLVAAHTDTDTDTDAGMPGVLTRLQRRRQELVSNRDALYVTLRQFDPEIAPEGIGTSDEWQKQFRRRTLQIATFTSRYKSQFQPDGT